MNILVDLDDTLYPEKQYIYQGFWGVAQFFKNKYGLDSVDVYLKLIAIFRDGSRRVFDDFLTEGNIIEDPASIVDIYRKTKRKLSLYNDVLSNLQILRALGNRLILLTNGDSETQRKKIDILKVDMYFDDIYILDDYGKEYWKPSILVFEKVYNKYKGSLRNYLFVGNGQEDLEFAKSLGIRFVFIDRKNSVRKVEIRNEHGVCVVKNLKEIVKMINK